MNPLFFVAIGGVIGYFGRKITGPAYDMVIKGAANAYLSIARTAAKAREDYDDALAKAATEAAKAETDRAKPWPVPPATQES